MTAEAAHADLLSSAKEIVTLIESLGHHCSRLRAAILAMEPSCRVPGCVRRLGHTGFHVTSDQIAKRVDA